MLPPSTMTRSLHRSARSGFTLLEVTVVTTLLLFGLLALTTTSQALEALRVAEAEQEDAQNAMETVVRNIQSISAAARVSSDPWPVAVSSNYAPGGSIPPTFDVRGLETWAAEASVGTIDLIADETLTDDEIGVVLGMPQDLDGDGAIANADVSTSAQMFPFVVRLRWRGPGGQRELVQGLYAAEF